MWVRKVHENVFPGTHCLENFRLLSETPLSVPYNFYKMDLERS